MLMALILVGCDSSGRSSLTTVAPDATTTTVPDDTCQRLATDTARYLELVVEVISDTPVDEFRDRESWPEEVAALEQQGEALDARSDRMECDPAQVQAAALAQANVEPGSGLAELLLEFLGQPE